MDSRAELLLREKIMHALTVVTAEQGYVTRTQLSSLVVDGEARRVIDTSRGIWNPRDLSATLSVVSSPDGPYDDAELDGALFRYDYRAGTVAGDNIKLRRAHELGLPIILLRKLEAGVFAPVFPTYVVEDDPRRRQFLLALDESVRLIGDQRPAAGQRSYAERLVRQRLHQAEFRGRVMRAYETQCAVCNLKLGRLLEAAHIIADLDRDGDPVVTNGLSLCAIHHGAYDAQLVGISPDYTIHINRDLLTATDGPMLAHGLQAMHLRPLTLPRRTLDRPDPDRLARRFDEFGQAG